MGAPSVEPRRASRLITGLKSLSAFGEWDADKSMWRRELPTPWGGSPIVVHEDPNRAGIGGEFFLWPASLVLCDYIFRNPSAVREHSVVELGSSHGLAAMAACSAGALRVIATDQAEVLPFLSGNIAANPAHAVEVAALDWGTSMERWGEEHGWGWEVVVGSDLTFNRTSFLPLLFTLQEISRRSTSCHERKRGCRILLLHDDDSVPGGKSLRLDFFGRAAMPYFSVEHANLQETCLSQEGRESSARSLYHSTTVHGYWLIRREDAPLIAAADCASDLAKWENARKQENANFARSTDARRPGLGITLPELLAHFRQAPASEPPAPAPRRNDEAPENFEPIKRASLQGSGSGAALLLQDTKFAGEPQCSLDELSSKAAKINWWDEDLEEPEPFEFTQEMLRGVAESGGSWVDLKDAADWDALVAAEEAAAAKNPADAWRHVSVDASSLPVLDYTSDDDGDDDDEGGDAEAVVDIDALRAAARQREGLDLPVSTGTSTGTGAQPLAPADRDARVIGEKDRQRRPGPLTRVVRSDVDTGRQAAGAGASSSRGGRPLQPCSKDTAVVETLLGTGAGAAQVVQVPSSDQDRTAIRNRTGIDVTTCLPPQQGSASGRDLYEDCGRDPDLDELD